ncbi:aromatic acid exporter family protein [Corynebacterium sp. 4HC-13]|uniref:FUSC family protein n=1 Tax=Corynebacterium anserum TaxID=2684406 RepID=UPI0016399CC5|nr:FUSC family protein [Corynebacterium anserum]MBC2681354.1 aromatic acid exporter family protein [Corynebacterium anserum]
MVQHTEGEKWSEPLDPSRPALGRLRHLVRRSPGVRAAATSLRRVAPIKAIMRVRDTMIFAIQCAIAAGLALWIAQDVVGHKQAFFAPIAAVISLGVTGGRRTRRSFELVLGAAVGVGVGDVVIHFIGSGHWQVSVVVLAAILAGTFVDKAGSVAIQSANTAVLIATIIPPGSSGALDRMVDALVGGLLGILVLAIVPNSPLKAARREVSTLISKAALVLDDVAAGVEAQDAEAIHEALTAARGTQTSVNAMLSEADGGSEVVALSPIYWTAKRYSKSMTRILVPVDNVMRNTRVLARRAEVLVGDNLTARPELLALIRGISNELGHLGALYAQGGTRGTRQQTREIPDIVRNLQWLGAQAKIELAEGTGLSGTVVLAQCRSIIVDALQVCGYSRDSAMACLAPTVDDPLLPPELHEE